MIDNLLSLLQRAEPGVVHSRGTNLRFRISRQHPKATALVKLFQALQTHYRGASGLEVDFARVDPAGNVDEILQALAEVVGDREDYEAAVQVIREDAQRLIDQHRAQAAQQHALGLLGSKPEELIRLSKLAGL